MQKVRDLLPPHKAAQTLSLLIDEPLGTCQKLLCGDRAESTQVLTKLLRTREFGEHVLLVIGDGLNVPYIEAVRQRSSLRALRKQIDAAQKMYEQQLREIAQ
jgi:hypothetical protein